MSLLRKLLPNIEFVSRKKKQQIKEYETVRIASIGILEDIYYSILDYDHFYVDDSAARELSIECQEIELKADGSQFSTFLETVDNRIFE